ncbi:zygote arrest protein 1 isoform X1 [Psammomys obesus]|uniref:zygote arrest protein 1 isoform X1 n=1 Tax=Psammomys obesus TaxID=48139 RepID=UPI002452B4D2|nr:zygote arrest protein 1 isoform X1 [Psammomys obesus]
MFPASTVPSCPHPYPAAAKARHGWRLGAGDCRAAPPSFLPGCRQLTAADYLDSYRRAQLAALLSRAGPRAVSSRDAAVQVNPRRDASVQCSLGRRTLQHGRRRPRPAPDAQPAPRRPRSPAGAARPARSWRPVAVYSPLGFPSLEVAGGGQTPTKGGGEPRPAPAGTPEPEPGGVEEEEEEAVPQPRSGEHDVLADAQAGPEQPPREDPGSEEAAAKQPGARRPEPRPAAETARDPGEPAADGASPQSPEQDRERLRFQFLEQKYGYYHCKDCNIRWESAYVWCVQGTNKVYFKQFCRECQKSYNPYRVEDVTCQSCKQTRCTCPVRLRLRHVDPKRPHRQDLCGRCKDKRLSCDNTFSFKYII